MQLKRDLNEDRAQLSAIDTCLGTTYLGTNKCWHSETLAPTSPGSLRPIVFSTLLFFYCHHIKSLQYTHRRLSPSFYLRNVQNFQISIAKIKVEEKQSLGFTCRHHLILS